MKNHLILIITVLPLTTPAFAGDIWSSWYAGLNVGVNEQRGCNTLTPQGQAPLFPVSSAQMVAISDGCAAGLGFNGGVDIGANHRAGNVVAGVEADVSLLSGGTQFTNEGFVEANPPAPSVDTFDQDSGIPWLATVRGRLGMLANDNTLFYLTGGLAIGEVTGSATEAYTAGATPGGEPIGGAEGSGSRVVGGWVAGAGVEMKLADDWSVKAEALYADLGSMNFEAWYDGDLRPFYADNFAMKTNVGILRVGINRAFDSPADDADSTSAADSHDWTGAYAGVFAGGVVGQAIADGVAVPPLSTWDASPEHWSANGTGLSGGVDAGYNFQTGSFVAGVEVDAGYLGVGATQDSPVFAPTILSAAGGAAFTARARLGMAFGDALVYGTGGLIVANVGANVAEPLIQDPDYAAIFTADTGWQTGWIAGGGIEYALADNWSIKGEALFYDLGSKLVTGNELNPDPPDAIYTYGWNIHNIGTTIRVGLNRGF